MGHAWSAQFSTERQCEPIAGAAPSARSRAGGVPSGRAPSRPRHGGRRPGARSATSLAHGGASGAGSSRRPVRSRRCRGTRSAWFGQVSAPLLAVARERILLGRSARVVHGELGLDHYCCPSTFSHWAAGHRSRAAAHATPPPALPAALLDGLTPRRRELLHRRAFALQFYAECRRACSEGGVRLTHPAFLAILGAVAGTRLRLTAWRQLRRRCAAGGYPSLIDTRGRPVGRRAPIDARLWRLFARQLSGGASVRAAWRAARARADELGVSLPCYSTMRRRLREVKSRSKRLSYLIPRGFGGN